VVVVVVVDVLAVVVWRRWREDTMMNDSSNDMLGWNITERKRH
jgi:hypothetical protein